MSYNDGNLIERAIRIALDAHKGIKDRVGYPYILHPLTVMSNVTGATDKIVAVLHDVIEDTKITLDDLEKYGMPQIVIEAVDAITKREDEEYKDYIDRCGKNDIARNVKISDLTHNMRRGNIDSEIFHRYKMSYDYLMGVSREIMASQVRKDMSL